MCTAIAAALCIEYCSKFDKTGGLTYEGSHVKGGAAILGGDEDVGVGVDQELCNCLFPKKKRRKTMTVKSGRRLLSAIVKFRYI